MRLGLLACLALFMCCITGDTAGYQEPVTEPAVGNTSLVYFSTGPVTTQGFAPGCTGEPPVWVGTASTESECLGLAQGYCGYRIASVCFDGFDLTCTFACIGAL